MRSASWPRGTARGRGVEPVDDEGATAADPIEAFARRSFRGGLGGIESKRRLLDFFPDEGVAEVFRPALADGLRFWAFGEHEERHVSPAARLVEDLFSVGWCGSSPDAGNSKWSARNLLTGAPSGSFVRACTPKSSLLRTASSRSPYHPIATG
jgi:hypothetical protein